MALLDTVLSALASSFSTYAPAFMQIYGARYINNSSDIPNGAITNAVFHTLSFALGLGNGSANPYFSMISCTLLFALLGGLSYLLIRKAVVKEN